MLSPEDRGAALGLAVEAVRRGAAGATRWLPSFDDLPSGLRPPGASFVTWREDGQLRGCIGSLVAREPLGIDVARHGADAAFRDPRFAPVRPDEVERLHLHVSVLGALERLDVVDRSTLRAVLRPGMDGVLIETMSHRGTFLPAVWDTLPDVDRFLDALWRKAGLRPGTWPEDLTVHRYSAEDFEGEARDHLHRHQDRSAG